MKIISHYLWSTNYPIVSNTLTFDFVFRCVIGEGLIWKQLHPALTLIPWLRFTVHPYPDIDQQV